jgi:Na+-transporting NADH:ubiquinone oxidoreductase subunit NqrB
MRSIPLTSKQATLKLKSHFSDPRNAQIICLSAILAYGLWSGVVALKSATLVAIAVGVLATEYGLFKVRFPNSIPTLSLFKSSVITCLSLGLLLRVADPALGLMAGFLAISSKALLRNQHGHWFNPANFALVICVLIFDGAWVSPGQWGHALWLAVLVGGAGLMVSTKAARLDTALWFLLSYMVIVFSRAYYLGDPWDIPLQQLQSSALLLFAFFMLTDPKTSPHHPTARAVYGITIAALGSYLQFQHFQSLGLFYGLFISCACVPLLNRLFHAPRYQWHSKR